jgi:hypothetical protein
MPGQYAGRSRPSAISNDGRQLSACRILPSRTAVNFAAMTSNASSSRARPAGSDRGSSAQQGAKSAAAGRVLGPGFTFSIIEFSFRAVQPCLQLFDDLLVAKPKEVSGDVGSVRRSMSWMMSSRILMARRSALAERLTSCVMIVPR